jgi:hypothetical protein
LQFYVIDRFRECSFLGKKLTNGQRQFIKVIMAKPPPDDAYEDGEPDRTRQRREAGAEGRPRRRYQEDDYDDEDDEPRPRRRRRQEADPLGGLIPYRNGQALAAYYCGVFSLIPCVGLILGPIALIMGILGLRYSKLHPAAKGGGHAIAGIVLGLLVLIGHLIVIGFIVLGILSAPHRR